MPTFFYDDINIYTDTSTLDVPIKHFGVVKCVCSGFVATYKSHIIISGTGLKIYVDEHVPFGEISAIAMAMNWLNFIHAYGFRPHTANIISDAKSSVEAVSKYKKAIIAGNFLDPVPPNTSKNTINFRSVAKNIAFNSIYNSTNIRFMYFPAHETFSINNPFKTQDIRKQVKQFCERSFIIPYNAKTENSELLLNKIDANFIYSGVTFNNIIDTMTRNHLFQNAYYIQNAIEQITPQKLGIKQDRITPLEFPFITQEGDVTMINVNPIMIPANL